MTDAEQFLKVLHLVPQDECKSVVQKRHSLSYESQTCWIQRGFQFILLSWPYFNLSNSNGNYFKIAFRHECQLMETHICHFKSIWTHLFLWITVWQLQYLY